ncbi:MAG: hypothetical protein LBG42_02440, partial [Treponema sp.]|nr:hypothetical protein [Treponema sp.]
MQNMRKKTAPGAFWIAAIQLAFICVLPAFGREFEWTGGAGDNDWDNSGNWNIISGMWPPTGSPGTDADDDDYVTIATTLSRWPEFPTGTRYFYELSIASGAQADINSAAIVIEANLDIQAAASDVTNAGALTLTGAVSLLPVRSGGVAFSGVTVNKTSGAVQLQDDLNITGDLTITSGSLNAAGRNVMLAGNFGNSVGTGGYTGGGTLTLNGTGLQTVAAGSGITLSALSKTAGSVAFTGTLTVNSALSLTVPVNLGGTINTTGGITLGAVTLTGASTLNSGTGAMSIASITGNTHDLALRSSGSTGTITVTGNATGLGAVTLHASGDTFPAGLVHFQNGLGAASLSAHGDEYPVTLTSVAGQPVNITGSATFANTGALTLDGTANNITFAGGVTATAPSSVTVSGAVNTTSQNMTLGNVTLAAATTLSTGTGSGNISMGSITGSGYDLDLVSRSGTITVTGSASNLGTVTLHDNNAGSTGAVTFSAGLEANTLVTVGQGHDITLTGPVNITGLGMTTFSNTGALEISNAGSGINVAAFAGGVTATAPSSVTVSGAITTANNMTLGNTSGHNVALVGTTSLSTDAGVGNGNITLGTVTNAASQALTVTAAGTGLSGDIVTFNGAVGSSGTPLSSLSVTSTGTVNFNNNVFTSGTAGSTIQVTAVTITGIPAVTLAASGTNNDIEFTVDELLLAGATINPARNFILRPRTTSGDIEFGDTNNFSRPIHYDPDFIVTNPATTTVQIQGGASHIHVATDSAIPDTTPPDNYTIEYPLMLVSSSGITLYNNYTSVNKITMAG